MTISAKNNKGFVKRHKIASFIAGIVVLCVVVVITAGIISAQKQADAQRKAVAARQARLKADPVTVDGIYNSLNKERATTGAKPLASNDNLTAAAEQYCGDMVKYKYFDYKNPKTGKKANSFIEGHMGSYYFKTYVSSIFSAMPKTQTATDSVMEALKNQSTNLNNSLFNSVGWAVCASPTVSGEKYIVGTLADIEDRPAPPQRVYVPTPSYAPTYVPSYSPTHCSTTYNDYGGYLSPTATTDCY